MIFQWPAKAKRSVLEMCWQSLAHWPLALLQYDVCVKGEVRTTGPVGKFPNTRVNNRPLWRLCGFSLHHISNYRKDRDLDKGVHWKNQSNTIHCNVNVHITTHMGRKKYIEMSSTHKHCTCLKAKSNQTELSRNKTVVSICWKLQNCTVHIIQYVYIWFFLLHFVCKCM